MKGIFCKQLFSKKNNKKLYTEYIVTIISLITINSRASLGFYHIFNPYLPKAYHQYIL